MTREQRRLTLSVLGAVALLALTLDDSGAVRAVGGAVGLFVVPGLAWTAPLGVRSPAVELGFAVVLSGVIETLIGVACAAAGAWSPFAVLTGTAVATVAGLIVSGIAGDRTVEVRV